ncbi:biopolymer transport protein ExbD [Gammaproteobacteria bacterium]
MNLRPRRRECPRFINLTSLIDVVFNLLLFFMVTTSFNRATEITLDLPTAESGQPPHEERTIEVTIDAQGHYYLTEHQGERALADQEPATVRAALQEAAEAMETASAAARSSGRSSSRSGNTTDERELLVVVNADGRAPHQSVVTVMDAARQVGLTHLTFATRQTPSSPSSNASPRQP